MKFIIDAQLPPALAHWLNDAGHEALHVEDIGLREAEDSPIWRYALENQAVIVTKDEDFAFRVRQSRTSPVIVWLRIGNCSKRALLEWFTPLLPASFKKLLKASASWKCVEYLILVHSRRAIVSGDINKSLLLDLFANSGSILTVPDDCVELMLQGHFKEPFLPRFIGFFP